MPEIAFVVPVSQSARAGDLAVALAAEIGRQDALGTISPEPPRPAPDRVMVAFDPECLATAGSSPERSILLLLDSPGAGAFETALEPARRFGSVFHPNAAAVERLRERGVAARHLQLGYSVAWPGTGEPRSHGRLEVMEGCGGYFDWVRALGAIHRGSAVLHEHSLGWAPLRPGEHLFMGSASALPTLRALLTKDRARLDAAHGAAIAYLREILPLELAASALIGAARGAVAQPFVAATPGQQAPSSK
jgi:hypothetical protein